MKNIDKILEIISSSKCGVSAKNILEKLNSEVNKTTIYRNIEKLLNEEKIIEDFLSSGEKRYSLKGNHHHHFVCDECGNTENIGCIVNPEIGNLENKFGFEIKNHSLVLNGKCKDCK